MDVEEVKGTVVFLCCEDFIVVLDFLAGRDFDLVADMVSDFSAVVFVFLSCGQYELDMLVDKDVD